MDIKLSDRAISPSDTQTQTMIRHAANYSWGRTVIFLTLRSSAADQARLQSYALGSGVFIRIVSLTHP